MNNSPFSPFVGRRRTVKDYKRRQSELPSDLIDWDAPEIPELDKQRIIYEEYIKECNEDHAIETLINDELFQVAHEVLIEMVQKQYEDKLLKERSQVNLLLGQIKMFEGHSQDLESNIKELENQTKGLEFQKENLESHVQQLNQELSSNAEKLETLGKELENQREDFQKQIELKTKEFQEHVQTLENQIKDLESRLEDLETQRAELEDQNKDLEFHSKELEAEISCQLDTMLLKKAEAEDLKRKWESAKNQLAYYKKLAKNDGK